MHSRFKLARLIILLVVVGLGTMACGKYSIGNLRMLMAFKDGNALYSRGEFPRAIQRYEAAIEHNPEMGVVYFFLGNSYDNMYKASKKGDPTNDEYLVKAVANYRLATEKIKDEDIQGPQIRKLSYEFLIAAYGAEKINDFAQAEPVAQKLISMEPNEPRNYQTLGKLLEDVGRFEEAEAQFKKATEVRPNEPLGYMFLAGYYDRQGDFDKGMAAFEDRARVEPNNPEAHHTIGHYYWQKAWKDYSLSPATKKAYLARAVAAEDSALALHGEYVEALVMKGILLRLQANMEKDPAKIKAMYKEADDLRSKATEVQKKQNAAGTSATPRPAGGKGGN